MERMFNCGLVQEYGRRFAELKDRDAIGSDDWQSLIVEFRRAINMVYAEAFNMGYDRDAVTAALNPAQRRTYQKTIEAWKNFQPLLDRFAKETDHDQSWELCYDIFNKMQGMASTMYRVAGKRIATLTAKVPEIFFPAEESRPSLRFSNNNAGFSDCSSSRS